MRTAILSAILLGTTVQPAIGQELPTTEQMLSLLADSLPAYWDVSEFNVTVSALQGDPITSKALIRFEANAEADTNLFSETGERIGPFIVVVETYELGQSRKLYGTMELDYAVGQWAGTPNIENPVSNLGQPRDMFENSTLVMGSEQQTEIIALLRDNTVAEANARLNAELASLQARQAQDVEALGAELEHQRASFEAERQELAQRHADALAKMDADYQAMIVSLEESFAPQVLSEETRLSNELERLRNENEGAVATLQQLQAAEISELQVRHAQHVGELTAQQAQIIEELEAGFTAKKERLERQLNDSESILTVQSAIIEAMQTAANNDIFMRELATEHRDRQLEFFQSFGDTISGSVECKSNIEQVISFPIIFEINEASGTGLTGEVRNGSEDQTYLATLTLASAEGISPVVLSFSMAMPDILAAYDVVLSQNGSMRGESNGVMLFDSRRNDRREGSCTLTLGGS